jgi:hypothetical protein
MNLLKYEINSYGHIFKIYPNGLIEESNESLPEFTAWKIANGEPILNTDLDLMGPIPIGSTPPAIPS